ncbi:MAG: phosphoglycolate phosphatase [Sulfurimonadaceae bacterium]|nr:phosphoglycolate phosphatase [Sulfurimonadaceae bacterium]
MKFTNKKVILFDLDGTLVDSAPDLALALNLTLERLGRQTFETETIRGWVGNGAQTLVKRGLSGSREVDDALCSDQVAEALKMFLDDYTNNLCETTVTYPGVDATLRSLKAKGYRLVLVTNKPYAFIYPLLEGLGLSGLFELCLGGDSLQERKPHPMPLLHVSEKLDVCVSECLMVGDSKNDIVAAKSAQMHSIGVTYGYNYGEAIHNYEPDRVVESFSELLECLE